MNEFEWNWVKRNNVVPPLVQSTELMPKGKQSQFNLQILKLPPQWTRVCLWYWAEKMHTLRMCSWLKDLGRHHCVWSPGISHFPVLPVSTIVTGEEGRPAGAKGGGGTHVIFWLQHSGRFRLLWEVQVVYDNQTPLLNIAPTFPAHHWLL